MKNSMKTIDDADLLKIIDAHKEITSYEMSIILAVDKTSLSWRLKKLHKMGLVGRSERIMKGTRKSWIWHKATPKEETESYFNILAERRLAVKKMLSEKNLFDQDLLEFNIIFNSAISDYRGHSL